MEFSNIFYAFAGNSDLVKCFYKSKFRVGEILFLPWHDIYLYEANFGILFSKETHWEINSAWPQSKRLFGGSFMQSALHIKLITMYSKTNHYNLVMYYHHQKRQGCIWLLFCKVQICFKFDKCGVRLTL